MPALTAEGLIGHGEQLAALRRLSASGTLPHALLVTGPDGVGKTAFASIAAADLTCLAPEAGGAACGECRSCHLASVGTHPDILRVTPPREETTIGQMREVRAAASLVPALSPRRVVVIERAETLNDQAANAILKVLEDAPPALVLILLAPSRESVLPTVRSRTLQIPLRPVPAAELLRHLEARGCAPEDARLITASAGGCPGRAISLMESRDLRETLGAVGEWLASCASASLAHALRLACGLRELAEQARKALPGPDDATDRQGLAWVLDALTGILQAGLKDVDVPGARQALRRWGRAGVAVFAEEANTARRLVLSYAQADLQLERLLIRVLSLPAPETGHLS